MSQERPFHPTIHAALTAAIEDQLGLKPLTVTGRIVKPWVQPEPFKVNQGPKIHMDFTDLEDRTAAILLANGEVIDVLDINVREAFKKFLNALKVSKE